MAGLLTVGEFARLTHLTVKTLHHYHEAGVLEPARVDPASGYRYYSLDQVGRARLVRRLRQARMPLTDVRAVLAAGDGAARRAAVAAHVDRLRTELTETAAAIGALREFLDGEGPPPAVTCRRVPDLTCLTLTADITLTELSAWAGYAYPRLFAALNPAAGDLGARPAGPPGALYGEAWFAQGAGPVTAFLPLAVPPRPQHAPTGDDPSRTGAPQDGAPQDGAPQDGAPQDGVRAAVVPGQELAVAVHTGPYDTLDRTYAALGRYALERGISAPGPAREVYLVGPAEVTAPEDLRTEVGWPITRTGPVPPS